MKIELSSSDLMSIVSIIQYALGANQLPDDLNDEYLMAKHKESFDWFRKIHDKYHALLDQAKREEYAADKASEAQIDASIEALKLKHQQIR